MKKSTGVIIVLMPVLLFSQVPQNTCLDCHAEMEDELLQPALTISEDLHHEIGLSCAGCHGGDPSSDDAETAMSPANGFVGAPRTGQIPQFCGKCHSDPVFMRNFNPGLATDQADKYWTSHHGIILQKGDNKAAQCVSCHGVHDIKKANDPRSPVYFGNVPATCAKCHSDSVYMKSYGIPAGQYREYAASSHGEALLIRKDSGAPACNDCHGNHAAMPPGISSIGHVCHQCHPAEADLFLASSHNQNFEMLGEAECVFCHQSHQVIHPTDELIGVHEGSVCLKCHSADDDGASAAAVMKSAIVELRETYTKSKELIDSAEMKGVAVSREQFELLEVRNSLVKLRKLVHTFDPDSMTAFAGQAMESANHAVASGEKAVNEVKNRRSGLYIFTLVNVLLILLLVRVKMKKR